jgi:hypothetical protein
MDEVDAATNGNKELAEALAAFWMPGLRVVDTSISAMGRTTTSSRLIVSVLSASRASAICVAPLPAAQSQSKCAEDCAPNISSGSGAGSLRGWRYQSAPN